MAKRLKPDDFTAADDIATKGFIIIETAYARHDNLLLGEPVYREGARIWLYNGLAAVVSLVAQYLYQDHGYSLVLYDGLRTVEAQEKMLNTQRIKDNPQWLEEPRLLSPPGAGAHPRGMAVDCSVRDGKGALLDMGTPFDFLAEKSDALNNPAHRDFPGLSYKARSHRRILDEAFARAEKQSGQPVRGLPQEWWDYRYPADYYEQFAPVSDADLPDHMRMTV